MTVATDPGSRDDPLSPRPLGRTGLEVSGVCVGTAELGDMVRVYPLVEEQQALATARRILSGPFTFVDTSNGYGESERRLGVVLREIGGVPRGMVLATKVDPLPGGPFDGPRVRASVAESRDRLGVDHFSLLHLHDPERMTFEEAMAPGGPVAVMQELVREGVVDHLGVAGGDVDQLCRFVDTDAFSCVLMHNSWTLLNRSAEPLLAAADAAGVAVLNGAPFGGGMLAKGPAAVPRYRYASASPELIDTAAAMEAACGRAGVPLAAAALQYSLRERRITSTVVGFSRPERVDQTLALARLPIPESLWPELTDLWSTLVGAR